MTATESIDARERRPVTEHDLSIACLFPGQGSANIQVLRELHPQREEVGEVVAAVDSCVSDRLPVALIDLLSDDSSEALALATDEILVSQLVLFCTNVAAYRILVAEGLRPDVLIGHSFGELAALTCADGYTTEDGARLVCARVDALALHARGDGRMSAFTTGPSRCRLIIDLVGDPAVSIAAENHTNQVVLAGPSGAVEQAERIADSLGIRTIPLASPYAFHSPLVEPAVEPFAAAISDVPQHPLRTPVYSPILERFISDHEDFADVLARQLVAPVGFQRAIVDLAEQGIHTFIECGGSNTVTGIVRQILPGERFSTHALFARSASGTVVDLPMTSSSADSADSFEAFWATYSEEIRALVRRLHTEFSEAVPPKATDRPAASTAVAREDVAHGIRGLYADVLEYPEDVFTDDALLEAELGIDSVKQVELLMRASELFGFSRPEEFRLTGYETMGRVIDAVHRLAGSG